MITVIARVHLIIWRMQAGRQVATNAQTKPTEYGCDTGKWLLPSTFVIITQPKSSYSFYCPMLGGRLSRPRHCSKGVQAVPKAVYCSGCRDKYNCPWWDSNLGSLKLQSDILPLDYCDLQHVFITTDMNYRHQWNEPQQILYEWQVINGLDTQCGHKRRSQLLEGWSTTRITHNESNEWIQ